MKTQKRVIITNKDRIQEAELRQLFRMMSRKQASQFTSDVKATDNLNRILKGVAYLFPPDNAPVSCEALLQEYDWNERAYYRCVGELTPKQAQRMREAFEKEEEERFQTWKEAWKKAAAGTLPGRRVWLEAGAEGFRILRGE